MVAVHAHGHVVDLVESRPGPSRRLDVGIVVHDLEGGKDPARFSGPRQTEVKGQLRGSRRRYRDTLSTREKREEREVLLRQGGDGQPAPVLEGAVDRQLPGTDLVHRYGGLSLNGRGQEKHRQARGQEPVHPPSSAMARCVPARHQSPAAASPFRRPHVVFSTVVRRSAAGTSKASAKLSAR